MAEKELVQFNKYIAEDALGLGCIDGKCKKKEIED